MSGRTLGQRATKVRVNNDGEHIRAGAHADPFGASNAHFGTKQSTLSFQQRADVPSFHHHGNASAMLGGISN